MSGPDRRWLVVGDDGSPAADVVWLWVCDHEWPGWRISVVTARPSQEAAPAGPVRAALRPWRPTDPRRLPAVSGAVEVEHLMAEADPRLVLDECADATLMAIGPRGRGLLKQLHLGSTAEWLVSASRPLCPLVVVRSARPTHRILLCTDGSTEAQQAVEELTLLPWVGGCRVTVLGVENGRTSVAEAVAEAAEALFGATGAEVEPRVVGAVRGSLLYDARSVILEVIDAERPDLVVVGTRGVGGLQRLLLGSTASAVVHHAACSVLVVRHRPAAGA